MEERVKTIEVEAIVAETDVAAIMDHFDVVEVTSATPPTGLRLLRTREGKLPTPGALVDHIREGKEYWADYNYVLAQMTHARFLPISYPRPTDAAQIPQQEKEDVDVLVVDTAVLNNTPVAEHVGGDKQSIKNARRTTSAEIHGTFVAGVLLLGEARANVEVLNAADPNNDFFVSDWELSCQLAGIARRPDPPDIVNLSLGGATYYREEPKATAAAMVELLAKDVLVLAAAGNDGLDDVVYPAKLPGVIAVGAQVADCGRPADWSNRGPDVDLWAPGVDVLGTTINATTTFPEEVPDMPGASFEDLPASDRESVAFSGWALWDGTSFATPQMAARLATMLIDQIPKQEALAQLSADFGDESNTASCI